MDRAHSLRHHDSYQRLRRVLSQPLGASSFLTAYVGIPIFLFIYFAHCITHRHEPWARDPLEVDLTSGLQEIKDEEEPKKTEYNHWWSHLRRLWE